MGNKNTGRVTVTLSIDRIKVLEKLAKGKGIPMPTYCRVMLSEIADSSRAEKAA